MKSHVSMEQKRCIVCARDYDSGAILLDKRLRASMERNTVTGFGLCPEHAKLHDDGYIALVAVDESKSDKLPNGNITPEGAYRTGEVMHIRAAVFAQIFTSSPTDSKGNVHTIVFVEPEVLEKLKQLQAD